ncbi:MAG: nucleoid-associated protein [Microscillaceae bacterium]|nr:nucleoid-associated protein [Microscillaceae bacterium]
MLDFSAIELNKMVLHQIGHKTAGEGLRLSRDLIPLDNPDLKDLILKYFLSPFKTPNFYNFSHPGDLNLNEVYHYASLIFQNQENFYEQSVHIAQHLYEQSQHPKIKSGEFYLCYLENCMVEDELTDALGLFKSETKDTFLKISNRNDSFVIDFENGINIQKLDKGCLIFNTEARLGYKVCVIDALNKTQEAHYWMDDFLKVSPRADNFYHTRNYMQVCRDFIEEVNQEDLLDRKDQIQLLNKSVAYFKEQENFDVQDFEEKVIQNPETIDAFRNFKKSFEQEKEIQFQDTFDISTQAVKKNQRIFKSVLKLDKNFSIYVHGEPNKIEKGFDEEKNLRYYKFYYEEER